MIKNTINLVVPALMVLWYLLDAPYLMGSLLVSLVLLGLYNVLTNRKYDGDMVVEEVNDSKTNYSFELNGPAEDLANKSEIRFKVKSA